MHGADLNIPVGLMFDRVVKTDKVSDIHSLALSYIKNPHFQNDREVWKTFIERFKLCQDNDQRIRWLRFCLKSLDAKSSRQLEAHSQDLEELMAEVAKIDVLAKSLEEFKELPRQKKEVEKAAQFLNYVIKVESGFKGWALALPWFVSVDLFISQAEVQFDSLPAEEKEHLLEVLKFLQSEGLLSHPRLRKKVRLLGEKVSDTPAAKELLESIRRENSALYQITFPEVNPKSFKEISEKGFTEQEINDVLDDIMTYETILMKRLTVDDFIGLAWSKGRGANIKKYIHFFNDLSETITDSILQAESMKGKARLIIFWIELALKAFSRNDLNLTAAIILKIDSVEISRLKEPLSHVPKPILDKKNELLELFSPIGNFRKLQSHIEDLNLAKIEYIPFIAPYLTHLTFIEESHKNEIEGQLNKEKAMLLAKTLGKIFRNRVQLEEKSSYRTHIIKIISEKEDHGTAPRSNPKSSTIFSKRGSFL